jgi:hypothetical protein
MREQSKWWLDTADDMKTATVLYREGLYLRRRV